MNPNRYFIPNMNIIPFRSSQALRMSNGLINRLFRNIKAFNWKGLLNGAGKTIDVVNKTIPLIKETKPMINNMKSIIALTKAFNQEATPQKHNQVSNKSITKSSINNNHNYPVFFV